MTSVLIIGGGGMIGQKLALSYKNNDTVSLLDMAFPESIDANAVHGSDSRESAAREVAYFFQASEICSR